MSQGNSDNLLQAKSESFWEPGNYKRTVKRIEDGFRLCNDLQLLIQERSDIEKGYAKNLRNWSKKWTEFIDRGPEYSTMKTAWKSILAEGERLSDVHLQIKERLCADIGIQIRSWQKESFHYSLLQLKERKDTEDQFKKAQKPWIKLLNKVERTKMDYYGACEIERKLRNREHNARADDSRSQTYLRKIQDRLRKSKRVVQKNRIRYEQALADTTRYKSVYIIDMTSVFEKCQGMEKARLTFFKDILFKIQASLDLTKINGLRQIYEDFFQTISDANCQYDLKWWSNNYGTNMAMNLPRFVEYTEDIRDNLKHSKPKGVISVPPITRIHNPDDACNFSTSSISKKGNTSQVSIAASIPVSIRVSKQQHYDLASLQGAAKAPSLATAKSSERNISSSNHRYSSVWYGNSKKDNNPFKEKEVWDDVDDVDVLVDNGEAGVLIRALYDYQGEERDELTFKRGDIFEKLGEKDEEGWCKGRMNGRVGLYPANYVEVVHT